MLPRHGECGEFGKFRVEGDRNNLGERKKFCDNFGAYFRPRRVRDDDSVCRVRFLVYKKVGYDSFKIL